MLRILVAFAALVLCILIVAKHLLGTCIVSGGPGMAVLDCRRRGRGRLAFYPLLRFAGLVAADRSLAVAFAYIRVYACSEQYDSEHYLHRYGGARTL